MYCRIVASEAGWKIASDSRFVMRRVFEGGEGVERGGKLDKSIDKGTRGEERADDEAVGECAAGGVEVILGNRSKVFATD